MNIGAQIKYNREKKGLTQAELAKSGGFDSSAIFRWEKNLRVPSLANALTVVKIFNMSLDEVFMPSAKKANK